MQFKGLDYDIDVSKPQGQRVCNIKYKGQDFNLDDYYVFGLSNFSANTYLGDGLIRMDQFIKSAGTYQNLIAQYALKLGGQITPNKNPNVRFVGYNFDLPGKEELYQKAWSGEIELSFSKYKVGLATEALNVKMLKE